MAIDLSAFGGSRNPNEKNNTGVGTSAFRVPQQQPNLRELGQTLSTSTPGFSTTTDLNRALTGRGKPGIVRTVAPQVLPGIGQMYSDYVQAEREWEQGKNIGQKFTRTFVEKPLQIYRGLSRGIFSLGFGLGRTAIEETGRAFSVLEPSIKAQDVTDTLRPYSGNDPNIGTRIERFLTGEEEGVRSYRQLAQDIDEFADNSEAANEWEKRNLGWSLGLGLFILDVLPSGRGSKPLTKTIQEIAEASTKKQVDDVLKGLDLSPKMRQNLSVDDLVNARTAEDVADVLRRDLNVNLDTLVEGTGAIGRRGADDAAEGLSPADALAARRAAGDAPQDAASAVGRQVPAGSTARRGAVQAARGSDDIADVFDAIRPLVDDSLDDLEVERLARASLDGDLADVIRTLDEGSDDVLTTESLLEDFIELQKRVFTRDNPDVNIETPEGQQLFNTNFAERFGGTPDQLTPTLIREVTAGTRAARLLDDRGISPQRAARAGGPLRSEAEDLVPIREGRPQDELVPRDPLDLRDTMKKNTILKAPRVRTGSRENPDLAEGVAERITRFNSKMTDQEVARMREENLLDPETLAEAIIRKRGEVSDEMLDEWASAVHGTLRDVADAPKGTIVNAEQFAAMQQIVSQGRKMQQYLVDLIDNGGNLANSSQTRRYLQEKFPDISKESDEIVLNQALAELVADVRKAEITLLSIASEGGRLLRTAQRTPVDIDNRLRILLNRINRSDKYTPEEKSAMIENIANINYQDSKQFIKALEQIDKSGFLAQFAEYAVAIKLYNPKTHAVNIAGNTARGVVDIGVKTIVNPKAAPYDLRGAYVGLKQGLKRGMLALTNEGYAQNLSKFVEAGGNTPSIPGKRGAAVRMSFRFLGAADEVFKGVAFQRQLYRDAYNIAKKEGLKGKDVDNRVKDLVERPTFAMQDKATKEAQRMTFQEDLDKFTLQLNSLRNVEDANSVGVGLAKSFVRLNLPFLKTPTNLFKQSIDFSPLAILKNNKKFRKALKEGDRETMGTIVAEALVGTAMMYYIWSQYEEGNINGGIPAGLSQKEKDQWYREKVQPYSIKINDQWYSYKRIDPFATVLGLTADVATLDEENAKKRASGEEASIDGNALLGVIASNLQDKTYLSGLANMINLFSEDEWERDYAFNSMVLGGVLPSIVGHVTRTSDLTLRRPDGILESFQSQIPGLSTDFPARVNVLGWESQRAESARNYAWNPVQISSAKVDPVTKGLAEMQYNLSVPSKRFSKNSIDYVLTDAEYEDYAKYVGGTLYVELKKLFASERFQQRDRDDQIKEITDIRSDAMQEWKDAYAEFMEGGGVTNDMTDVQRARAVIQGNLDASGSVPQQPAGVPANRREAVQTDGVDLGGGENTVADPTNEQTLNDLRNLLQN